MTGFKAALTRVLNEYGRKYKILKDDESNSRARTRARA